MPPCTTMVRCNHVSSISVRMVVVMVIERTPITLSEPINLISLSDTLPWALPWPSVLKLHKSPTWRSSSSGAPWVLLWGLTSNLSVPCSLHRVVVAERTVRSSAGAAVGVVTESVDVHAALSVGVVAGDVP